MRRARSTCDAPAWGTKNRIIGIGTQFTLIEFDFGLVPGAWRLQTVNSDGQNGEVGGEFFVEPCNGCDNSISAQAAAQAKAAANQMGQGVAAACLGFALKDLKGAVTGARSKLKDLHQRHTAYTTGDKGFLATVVPVIGGFGLSFEIPSFGNPGEEKAMKILKDLVCSATEMYASIAADPLDPGYTQIAQPTFGSLAVPLNSQATTLANLLDTGTGYGEAMLHGYERYQGAVAASAPPYVHAQARAVGQMGRSQLDQALATVAALRAEADRLDTLPEFAGPVASASTRDVISSI